MRSFVWVAVCVCVVVLLIGCHETEYEFTVNPDGSGKVVVEATVAQGPSFGGPADPKDRAKQTVANILTRSKGVVAWKDVAFELKPESELWFKGTAYFDDLSKLRIEGIQFFSASLVSAAGGNKKLLVKEADGDALPGPEPVKLTDEEVGRLAVEQKQKYHQSKMMAQMMFEDVKTTMRFRLPGKVTESAGLKPDPASGLLALRVDGPTLFRSKDELMADDAWVRRVIRAGYKVDEHFPMTDPDYRKKVFGTQGDIEATLVGEMKSLFDYKAEVAEAKKGQAEMLDRLGLKQAVPKPAAGGFKRIQVVGLQFVNHPDWAGQLNAFNTGPGCLLAMLGELPGSFLEMTGGRLERAVAANGEDLLLKDPNMRFVLFPYFFSADKTRILFYLRLKMPGPGVAGIRELSGTLEYTSASESKEVDLGFKKLATGAKGTMYNARLSDVSPSIGDADTLKLTLDLAPVKVKALTSFDAAGKERMLLYQNHSGAGEGESEFVIVKSSLPQGGRLAVHVHTDLQRYEIPFVVENVSLTGLPLQP